MKSVRISQSTTPKTAGQAHPLSPSTAAQQRHGVQTGRTELHDDAQRAGGTECRPLHVRLPSNHLEQAFSGSLPPANRNFDRLNTPPGIGIVGFPRVSWDPRNEAGFVTDLCGRAGCAEREGDSAPFPNRTIIYISPSLRPEILFGCSGVTYAKVLCIAAAESLWFA